MGTSKWILSREGRNMPNKTLVRQLVQETEKGHVAGAPWAEIQPLERERVPIHLHLHQA